jgi:hypothetical protein
MLAVAYSNLDDINGYNPNGADVLIAKLVDTDADGLPSAGDTLYTNQYPLNFDATAFGNFQEKVHTVSNVAWSPYEMLRLSITPTDEVVFQTSQSAPFPTGTFVEQFYEASLSEALEIGSLLRDNNPGTAIGPDPDYLKVFCCTISRPDTEISEANDGTDFTDDPFIDVDILV